MTAGPRADFRRLGATRSEGWAATFTLPALTPFIRLFLFGRPQLSSVPQHSTRSFKLEGLGSRNRGSVPRRAGPFARIGGLLLVAYWTGCLTVITFGLDRLYPEVRPAITSRLATLAAQAVAAPAAIDAGNVSPTPGFEARSVRPVRSFRTCAAAHAAGVYDIPAGSPAYRLRQDGDGDGLACEPY